MCDVSKPYSVYDNLRVTSPAEFYSLPVQRRMRYAQKRQGLAFYDHPTLRQEGMNESS